ncbi:hypothetical protein [Bacillus mycoides]|uniref:hypothetical protein n=1 Tax=Bacillus mycoides TaxID=1405 RepID=UPI001C02B0D8|nr:hypothetical protein [Bacillus mycoides]QWH79140.1 hypothetical protein EXW59_21615 [Bacillus mycoides]QWI44188.1 hypothetical protein EXW55_14870 [Bacillus mycoides]
MNEERPKWLKSMESGIRGEARTYAMLVDHFWVLKRSVDVNGADFIIQRGLINNDLNADLDYPRLGFVQAKYITDLSSTIKIDKTYVYEGDKPRNNFFLLIHTDIKDEDYSKFVDKITFSFDSNEIDKLIDLDLISIKLETKQDNNNEKTQVNNQPVKEVININLSKIINSEEAEISSRGDSENKIIRKIHSSLDDADYYAQLSLFRYLGKNPNYDNIIKKYKDTHIASLFYDCKQTAYKLLQVAIPYVYILREIIYEDEPSYYDEDSIKNLEYMLLKHVDEISSSSGEIFKLRNNLLELKGSLNDFETFYDGRIFEELDNFSDNTSSALKFYNDDKVLKRFQNLISKSSHDNMARIIEKVYSHRKNSTSGQEMLFWEMLIQWLNTNLKMQKKD